jgi:UDP-N-acetylglucosamine 2-epimerase (non-hydrolysing)
MRILSVAGARPNFIKLAPLLAEMRRREGVESSLVHTGQHYDHEMSGVFLEELGLAEPDVNLGIGSGGHGEQTGKIMVALEGILKERAPDVVVTVGDVNSTLAASLTAAKLLIPVVHVEAGVRSFDRTMPEEINRVVTDAVSDLLLTPSREADENLRREGIAEERIEFVGNVMADTLLGAVDAAVARQPWLKWDLAPREYAVLTLHRVSNVDDERNLTPLVEGLCRVASGIPVVFPIHPRTRKRLAEFGLLEQLETAKGLIQVEPLGYLDFVGLVSRAQLVLTDSGGIQAETSILGVQCLTLRETTEWPVTIRQGTNRLVGTDPEEIVAASARIVEGDEKVPSRPELWDGQAAKRSVDRILR